MFTIKRKNLVASLIVTSIATGAWVAPAVGDDAIVAADPSPQAQGSIPENPKEKLPKNVANDIPNDATMVAPDLAVVDGGQVKNVETGQTVTDPAIVGTKTTPPDPLDRTNGKRFIPVDVADVRAAMGQGGATPKNTSGTSGTSSVSNALGINTPTFESVPAVVSKTGGVIQPTALQGNGTGVYWGWYNNTPAFFDGYGTLFAQQAKGVIDVSKHQGIIDWNQVKASGVDGAIIRIGFGAGNPPDSQALRNISEAKRLGIPFGVYLYSYADTPSMASEEGWSTVSLLRQLGVQPGDLAYPVYYDLENWQWTGHTPPTDPAVYEQIVNNWWWQLQNAGYNNLSVYSYRYYLNTALNAVSIHQRTHWVAVYGKSPGFAYPANFRGWQYYSQGQIPGIVGNVDINAFGNKEFNEPLQATWIMRPEHIDVGVILPNYASSDVQYLIQTYNVNTKTWKTLSPWGTSNWASWLDNKGVYWLHAKARDKNTGKILGERTIPFNYTPGTTAINGTYAGFVKDGVLLGISSNNPNARFSVKIFDYGRQQWVAQFSGQWSIWKPTPGVYWTHYEVYTSDGRLAETRTYAFGV
ncbi:glycoside hydrolase family 25 protein [Arcanobacterium ihumii]|uniref:glycoside hydrolase family 25 protein n=1 Tax=Arcanobacterium ihumii TaxID=2138162 RepID=UPI00190F4FC0|nr:glycoside hydrolase family 25 protein [Arcanobacterium ihumii]